MCLALSSLEMEAFSFIFLTPPLLVVPKWFASPKIHSQQEKTWGFNLLPLILWACQTHKHSRSNLTSKHTHCGFQWMDGGFGFGFHSIPFQWLYWFQGLALNVNTLNICLLFNLSLQLGGRESHFIFLVQMVGKV